MIGKAKSCLGGFSLFDYVIDEKKGYELMRNHLCGTNAKAVYEEMKIIQSFNLKAKNKLISLVLSPHIQDGKNLSDENLRKITQFFLADLKINPIEQQFIAFIHTEKEHKHIHILMNRVQLNGSLIPDHFIGKKAQWSAHRIAKKFSLVSAKQMRIDKIKKLEEDKDFLKATKRKILIFHNKILETNPTSLKEYIEKMREKNIGFIPSINKKGQLQGYRIRDFKTQREFKASDIHKTMGLKSLLEFGLPAEEMVLLHSNLMKSQIIAHENAQKRLEKQRTQKEKEIEKVKIIQVEKEEPKKRIRFKR